LPGSPSACHGGIWRDTTLLLIDRAQGRASSYVMSDIGATSPCRWHVAHFAYRSGAMSFPNDGVEVWAKAVAGNKATAIIQPTGMWDRIMTFTPR
jgi:hypothetical protein